MTWRGRILVTGASRGIGEAVAVALADRGYDLVLWARTGDQLEAVAARARARGVEVRTAPVDIGCAAEVLRAAAASLDLDQGLAGLVLNAGRGVWSPLTDLDPADWAATIGTNLDGTYHVLRAALPLLTRNPGSLIVGMLSDSVLYPFAGRAAYAASKAGMHTLLEVARRETRASGVRISAVFPSRVDTFFQGGQAGAAPGSRDGALSADQVAAVVASLFDLPAAVEIRQLQLAAMTTTFGLLPERVTP
jgi:NADP-dependent 3-hydroxy acid dehydrogenase YdfG